jgi:O-phosphoseryl-tRNA(Sec) selenium transferase
MMMLILILMIIIMMMITEYILEELSIMDSNNFQSNCGVGEREGRVYSSIVSRRHHGLSHGIGRSGNISEQQPKAAGSSIIYKLTTYLASHALELAGLNKPVHCLVLPFATGMTLTMCMLTMKKNKPLAKYVIWSRIDQKSCFKSIFTAGLTPLVVENVLVNGELQTDLIQIQNLIELYGQDVLCVLSTTSCFTPRQPDQVDEIAKMCKLYDIGHIINNAYGLQCQYICKLINRAALIGRVDAVVQSTDKNFMVPVGGAIISSSNPLIIEAIAKLYPGRASISPILDLFITLLSMGEDGLLGLWRERLRLLPILTEKLRIFANINGEKLLVSPKNSISIGISCDSLCGDDYKNGDNSKHKIENDNINIQINTDDDNGYGKNDNNDNNNDKNNDNDNGRNKTFNDNHNHDNKDYNGNSGNETDITASDNTKVNNSKNIDDNNDSDGQKSNNKNDNTSSSSSSSVSFLGAMLFQRNVSGCRVIQKTNEITNIEGIEFTSWGAHKSFYPMSYFTAACTIGLTELEIDLFIDRLNKVWKKYEKTDAKKLKNMSG